MSDDERHRDELFKKILATEGSMTNEDREILFEYVRLIKKINKSQQ